MSKQGSRMMTHLNTNKSININKNNYSNDKFNYFGILEKMRNVENFRFDFINVGSHHHANPACVFIFAVKAFIF